MKKRHPFGELVTVRFLESSESRSSTEFSELFMSLKHYKPSKTFQQVLSGGF